MAVKRINDILLIIILLIIIYSFFYYINIINKIFFNIF